MPTYKVDEWDGTKVEGTFYSQDLQKVTVEDDDLFRIDRIVKRKGDKVLVRWKGWPDKYDTWLNECCAEEDDKMNQPNQYILVHSDVLSIIETQVAEDDGKPVEFSLGATSVTFHFKYE